MQQAFAQSCDDCGVLIQGLIRMEDRARVREMLRVNEEIKAALPGTNILDLVDSSFCRAIFRMDGRCDRVVLVGPGGRYGDLPDLTVEPNDIIVRLAIEFAPPASGIKLDAAPFDPVSNRNAASVAAARKYWLTGNPSVLATDLARSFEEVASIISARSLALDH